MSDSNPDVATYRGYTLRRAIMSSAIYVIRGGSHVGSAGTPEQAIALVDEIEDGDRNFDAMEPV